jgi:hypothetical protein
MPDYTAARATASFISMHHIEDFVPDPKEAAFKQDRNFSATAAVCDLGDGTTVRIITQRRRAG